MRSSRSVLARSLALSAAIGLSLVTASPAMASGHSIVRDGFAGSVPDGPPIAGVDPGGAPWVLGDDSEVRVREDGRIELEVDDLVIPARGDNPVPMMIASLVCDDMVVSSTPAFAVDPEGDGEFEGKIWVPKKCADPQVLIRNAAGNQAYFAFTHDMGGHHHHR